MKRFIDLRGQSMVNNFAWYCTVHDKFETFWDEQTWETWTEFERDYLHEGGDELERYKSLCPEWALLIEAEEL